jgi:aryl-alcohol dehydrogenase-like predicted oxidoreductase
MRTRNLGAQGPAVSAIGLGCMGMSDFYGSKASRDDAESLATIGAALDAGVTLLDTGDFYGMGHNEALVAKAIAGRREGVFLSVKFGAQRSHSGAFLGFDGRPVAVKTFAAYSLQRLGVEVIDLYQPARVDPAVPLEETVGAVADLIKEGKVRYLGVSEMNAAQLRRAHAVHPVAALQIEYSLATRVIEPEILPTARELGVAIVAYGALSRGLLTNSFDGKLPLGDFRAHSPRFTGANLAHNLDRVAVLREIAAAKGCSAAQLAIAWVLARGEDIIPIVGTTKRSRLPEILGALDIELDAGDLARLEEAFPPGAIAGERYPVQQMGMVAQ